MDTLLFGLASVHFPLAVENVNVSAEVTSFPGHLQAGREVISFPGHLQAGREVISFPGHLQAGREVISFPGHLQAGREYPHSVVLCWRVVHCLSALPS